MATYNVNIATKDGWVAVTPGAVNCVKITSNAHNHPFFVTTSVSAPGNSVIGYKQSCDGAFECDEPSADKYYVRVAGNTPDKTRIDCFYIEAAGG